MPRYIVRLDVDVIVHADEEDDAYEIVLDHPFWREIRTSIQDEESPICDYMLINAFAEEEDS